MENPYRRIRELTKIGQRDFAKQYNFSRTYIMFIESGQVPYITDDARSALVLAAMQAGVDIQDVLNYEYNGEDLRMAYTTWQANERTAAAYLFQNALPQHGSIMPAISPFTLLIKDVTRNGSAQRFCKILKVPSATVTRYERGAAAFMPSVIREALNGVRYPYIDELADLQFEWATR